MCAFHRLKNVKNKTNAKTEISTLMLIFRYTKPHCNLRTCDIVNTVVRGCYNIHRKHSPCSNDSNINCFRISQGVHLIISGRHRVVFFLFQKKL